MSAILTTLVSFSGTNGKTPYGDLIADPQGDLFGTNAAGGADDDGAVFEIVKTAGGYASTPTMLVSFDYLDGEGPEAGLLADTDGDLLGTTVSGAGGGGRVFEIAKTPTGYAGTPIILADGGSNASLIADSAGDLFGTDGAVFEIAKTPTGYAASTTLASFGYPGAETGLVIDSAGDLFGTSLVGYDDTVFEIAKTPTGYPSTPITLVSFHPGFYSDSLSADANGDLFGADLGGGAGSLGAVFEVVKTPVGYASASTTLVSFNGADGEGPKGSLIVDANGDLFGVTSGDSPYSGDWPHTNGTVFEIKKTVAGYASVPTTLVSFDGADGANPLAGLLADAHGDLFGTTSAGGLNSDGTVFEITNSGFVTTASATPASDGILFWSPSGQAAIWGMDGTNVIAGGTVSPNPGPGWFTVGTGDFNADGLPDLLWQNFDNGQAAIWDMNNTNVIGGGAVTPNPGPNWYAVSTGDFNDDGFSDILWQNANGQASIWEMNGNKLIGGGAVSPNPGPSWYAVGTGDFNDDGRSDILWQNDNGQAAIWEMNGNKIIGGGAVSPNPGPNWYAVGTGDFNDDGFSDILFQNFSTGQVSVWEMDGTSLIGGGKVSPSPGTSWYAVGTGDFNGDGFSDILFQNRISRQTAIWDMNGTKIIGGGAISANAGPNWYAIGLT